MFVLSANLILRQLPMKTTRRHGGRSIHFLITKSSSPINHSNSSYPLTLNFGRLFSAIKYTGSSNSGGGDNDDKNDGKKGDGKGSKKIVPVKTVIKKIPMTPEEKNLAKDKENKILKEKLQSTLISDKKKPIGGGGTPARPVPMTKTDVNSLVSKVEKLKEKLSSLKEIDGYVLKSKNPRKDVSLERNFITPVRAMQDFLLTSHELIGLRKTMRRSPHADEPPITVYWRKDVEAKAAEVWGNLTEMYSEKLKRDNESAEYRDAVFNIKRILKKYREHSRAETSSLPPDNPVANIWSGSGKIVLTAVCINACNFVIKLFAWWFTGSHSLFAESIHSLADTINQMILAFGIHKSTQRANVEHPYGYANMRHVASLISGVGIFCVGAGLSFYHGIIGLVALEHIESLYWAFYILGGSLVSEGATLFMAVSSVRKRAKENNVTVREFILRGQDPSLNVVILEDTAAVAGVAVAATCMGLTSYLSSPIPDAIGSLVIGGILGSVASFIIYSNSAALVGRSIPRQDLNKINAALECDVMIRAIHDVKGIDMGNTMVRYKAEVDFDGRELTRAYMEKLDIGKLLEEVKGMKTTEEFESFLYRHGENIVDTLGAEIDRIEVKLKKEHPEIRHCDLEIL